MSDIDNFNKWYSKAKEGYQYSEREIAAAAWVTALETVKPFIRAYDAWSDVSAAWSEEFDTMIAARDAVDDPDTSAMDDLRAQLAQRDATINLLREQIEIGQDDMYKINQLLGTEGKPFAAVVARIVRLVGAVAQPTAPAANECDATVYEEVNR